MRPAFPPFTVKTLNRLAAKGLQFSYATARRVTEGLTANIPVIVYNGGAIMESATGKALYRVCFTPEELDYVKLKLLKYALAPLVYALHGDTERVSYDRAGVTPAIEAYLASRRGDSRLNPVPAESVFAGTGFYFTLIHADRAALAPLYEEMEPDGRFTVTLQKDMGGWWLEIMPKKSTKAEAVNYLRKSLDCDELVVFGDGINDIPLFLAAERAYAVENAVEKLKLMSTAVIGSNESDEVARFLLRDFGQA